MSGNWQPRALVGIGFAAREGVKVDLSSVGSTRKALLDAKPITCSDSSTGGLSEIEKVLTNLDLTDAARRQDETVTLGGRQASIATGEIDLGLFNLSEIPRAPGCGPRRGAGSTPRVRTDGPRICCPTLRALLKYFRGPASRAIWDKTGLELVGN